MAKNTDIWTANGVLPNAYQGACSFIHLKIYYFDKCKPSEYMPYWFFQKQSATLVYVCLKLVKNRKPNFYLKLFIAIDQKGNLQQNH